MKLNNINKSKLPGASTGGLRTSPGKFLPDDDDIYDEDINDIKKESDDNSKPINDNGPS
jgi:hypothetical protein